MIIGECPYCNNINMTPIGPQGAWSKESCGGCKKDYWLQHSRLDPMAYALENVQVDEVNKKIIGFDNNGGSEQA